MAIENNIILLRGNTKTLEFTPKDSSGETIDLTNYVGKMYLSINLVNNISPENPISKIPASVNTTTSAISAIIDETLTGVTNVESYGYQLLSDIGTEENPNIELWAYGIIYLIDSRDDFESIPSLVNTELLGITDKIQIEPKFLVTKTKYWKLFLIPLVNFTWVNPVDKLSDENWDLLHKTLIAKLIVFEAFQLAVLNNFLALVYNYNVDSEGGNDNVKKITTGPSDVEFFDTFKTLIDYLKPSKSGSVLDSVKMELCNLAARLMINLPMCPPIPQNTTVPKFYKSFRCHD